MRYHPKRRLSLNPHKAETTEKLGPAGRYSEIG
jgi:hypothetical protein